MHTSVVAKMYVSAVNASHGLGADYTGVWAHLNAVYSPDKSTENYSFSSATPNASAKVYYRKGEGSWDFSCGQFYRLYFERIDASESGVPSMGDHVDATVLTCSVTAGSGHGSSPSNSVLLFTRNQEGNRTREIFRVEMTINNPSALAFFEQGGLYRVRFEETTKDGQ